MVPSYSILVFEFIRNVTEYYLPSLASQKYHIVTGNKDKTKREQSRGFFKGLCPLFWAPGPTQELAEYTLSASSSQQLFSSIHK